MPHATELLYALGLGDRVVGVSHECDHPADAARKPRVARSLIADDLEPARIDELVRERIGAGEQLYELDEDLIEELDPELIVTQALCAVCAVSADDVRALAARLPSRPNVITLDPATLGETMGDIRTVAQATGTRDAALSLVERQRSRIDKVKLAVRKSPRRTVVALEWLDPVFAAGHWTPQIIDLAGGIDVLGFPGEHSEQTGWDEVRAARPEVVLVIPCGYDADAALAQAGEFAGELRSTGAREIIALDANAYFSRPGPRLVDGLETLAHALHPDAVPEAPGRVLRLGQS